MTSILNAAKYYKVLWLQRGAFNTGCHEITLDTVSWKFMRLYYYRETT